MIKQILPPDTLIINLAEPQERLKYLGDPQELIRNCRALKKSEEPRYVFIDEVQMVPDLFNAIQSLYDADKTAFRFILCGSSARRLKATGTNLLPGRSILHRLYPLINEEYDRQAGPFGEDFSPLLLERSSERATSLQRFTKRGLEDRLEVGISAPTMRAYYQLLEDMFIGFTVPSFSGSEQKSISSSNGTKNGSPSRLSGRSHLP